MASRKPGAGNNKNNRGGMQQITFKRHMSYAPSESDVGADLTKTAGNKTPRKIYRFGFADDGGRYELLMSAIARGRLHLAKTLISVLPPNSAADALAPAGENSIMVALKAIDDPKRRRAMIELLVGYGARVSHINRVTGATVLLMCCGRLPNRETDLKWFLDRWPVEMDIAQTDFMGNNALHTAVLAGNMQIVIHLLRISYRTFCDLDKPNNDKLTPYLLAHKLGHVQIADLIDKTSSSGISFLDQYMKKSASFSAGRHSLQEENINDTVLPALVNHTIPARFDGGQLPVRNRTAIRREGDEERLNDEVAMTLKEREHILIRGQPEHLPRVPLPSAFARRVAEEHSRQHRSFINLSDTLALFPDYAAIQELKRQPMASTKHRFRKNVAINMKLHMSK